MKIKKETMRKKVLLFLWQLPQNVIGFLLTKLFRCVELYLNDEENDIRYFIATRFNKKWSGVSLGNYIIIAKMKYATETTIKHEHGHQIQSQKLGLLYLLVIGLPSFFGNIYDRFAHWNWSRTKRLKWYYNQPWEKSADKLGKVNRVFSL